MSSAAGRKHRLERQRAYTARWRERCRDGVMRIALELTEDDVQSLVDVGELPSSVMDNRESVTKAVGEFLRRSIARASAADRGRV
jgi:hypothetical protein